MAGGRIRWEIDYPEREAFGIAAKVAVYKRTAKLNSPSAAGFPLRSKRK